MNVEDLWNYCTMIVQTGNHRIPVQVKLDNKNYNITGMDFDNDGLMITIELDKD